MATQNITKSTMETLEDIKNMQKDIMFLLDRIEGQRTGQVHRHEAENTEGTETSTTADTEDDTHKVKNETGTGARPKMKNNASAEVRVLKEQFQLSQEQTNYCKSLRRHFVPMDQDNRLSVKFSYSQMKGSAGTLSHTPNELEPEISVKPPPAQQSVALNNPTIQHETDHTFHTAAKPDAEKQALSNDFTNSSPSTKEKTEPKYSNGAELPLSPKPGTELTETRGKYENADTISQISNVPAAEGQRMPDVIDNQFAATRDAEDNESTHARSPVVLERSFKSQVETKMLEPQSQTEDAATDKSESEDEDPGKGALGIGSNILAKSPAAGEEALTNESRTKLVKDCMKQMGLPDSEVFDHFADAYFETSTTPDGEFDPGAVLTPEGMSKMLNSVLARSGLEDSSLVDQFTSGWVKSTFTPEGKMDIRKMGKIWEQNAKGKLGFEVPVLYSLEDEPVIEVSEVDTRAAVRETEANGRSHTHKRSESKEDASPPEGIDINVWLQWAEKVKNEARRATERRSKGMDTLFLLDVSGSMKGAAWGQAIGFIKNFLECLQGSGSLHDKAFEHVALITFGGETCVHQHLTCDYVQLHRKIDSLKPSGPSPLLGGVIMLEAAILGGSQIFTSNDYKIPPRVFLITDGKPTLSSRMNGVESDRLAITPQEREAILNLVLRIHSFNIRFYPVPVGSSDGRLLQEIASVTEGSFVSSDDWKVQAAAFKNYQLAATLGLEGLNTLLTGPMSEEDREQCHDFLTRFEQERETTEIEGLPPLGSRVELGASATSNGRIGTVSKLIGNDKLGVTWDYPDDGGVNRSTVSVNQVRQINMPRVLFDELIAPGCRVRRGPDWRYEDADGGPGNIGSVYDVDISAIVKVRWDNGNTSTYRFGTNGWFDLEIVEGGRVPESGAQSFKNSRMTKNRSVASKNSEPKKQRPSHASTTKSTPSSSLASSTPLSTSRTSMDRERMPNLNRSVASKNSEPKKQRPSHASTTKSTPFSSLASSTPLSTSRTSMDRERMPNLNRSNPPSVTVPGQWFWQSGDEWKPFADEGNALIEEKYQSNPNGTVIVNIDNESYRVVLPKLYMTHIHTKVKHTIERRNI